MQTRLIITGSLVALSAMAFFHILQGKVELAPPQAACLSSIGAQVDIKGGTYTMGAAGRYPDEGPSVEVRVEDFSIDVHEVTNAQFRRFVEDTGYMTVAEREPDPAHYPGVPPEMLVPGSVVFVPPTDGSRGFKPLSWWRFVPGANWRHPRGPGSDIKGKDHLPVVHVAYEDALAYAKWAGRALPTEAQWEYAARGGLNGKTYSWGDERTPDDKMMANTWQGIFPVHNSGEDGFRGVAPVGCFSANGYGLYDMIGNVWEWTASPYYPSHAPSGKVPDEGYDPRQPGVPVRVIKGGSFLCAPNYCMRYRPAARHAQETGLGTDHIGFRTVSAAH
ncbi:MAG: formylglycine-generating enzyme family protein [Alphaproteobacteria bacterium]|nr:MAG: formylglycine-generating enzyme family protein [Alphaproteobacteria bacterium]